MIFVTLGTQDKGFPRLLEAIDSEIEKGNIKEKVVVQAGYTKYESKNMQILDLVSQEEFDKMMDKCSLVITHGGAGSILSAIKKGKIVIAAARLKKYKEHTNDHQRQIIKEFSDAGYILELRDFQKLGKLLEKAKTFKPRKFVSNTENMINLISNYIEEDNHVSWYNKCRRLLSYLFFGILTVIINILIFDICRNLSINLYVSSAMACIISLLFSFITNKLFVFKSKDSLLKNNFLRFLSFIGIVILLLLVDIGCMYLFLEFNVNEICSNICSFVLIILLNYIFSKIFIFRK